MKVLIINTYDKGGAAKACLRLHKGLLEKNINSKVLLKNKESSIEGTYEFKQNSVKKSLFNKLSKKISNKLGKLGVCKLEKYKNQQFIKNRDNSLECFSFPKSNFDITKSAIFKDSDIINLHWVSGFLDYNTFFKKNNKPVIWTLHDMNPFSGGEHYQEKLNGISHDGKPKLRIINENESSIQNKIIKQKEEILKNIKNLHIIVLCNWMYNEVKKSNVFKRFPVHLIPNGIDTNIFSIRDRDFSRDILGIPNKKKVVLFVADYVNNSRKGLVFLTEALKQIKTKEIILCVVGSKDSILDYKDTIYLGKIYDELFLSLVYSSSDVLVIPSIMDNLPNTALESTMCGTPLISFKVGGLIDIIKHKENGLLCDKISADSLSSTIDYFFKNITMFSRKSIRESAILKYDIKKQTKSYEKLFKSIIN